MTIIRAVVIAIEMQRGCTPIEEAVISGTTALERFPKWNAAYAADPPQSARSASRGSTRVARHAGSEPASTATSRSVTATKA